MKTACGYLIFMAKINKMTSQDQEPRSTKSPLKRNGVLGEGIPDMLRIFMKSKY